MKSIVGFGALNLDLIFEVDDLQAISSEKVRLEPGKEFFGSDQEFQSLFRTGESNRNLEIKKWWRFGSQYDGCPGPYGISSKVHRKSG